MSPEIDAKDILAFLYVLLPGFVAAWMFYGLTAHPKADWFERTVQALIFTVIVQAVTFLVRLLLVALGRTLFVVGDWTLEVNLVWSLLLAGFVGIVFAATANSDWLHRMLRERRVTRRTSFPSEWFSAFCQNQRWVVLHLTGDRRLFGWPNEWPDRSDRGHFVIEQPEWLDSEGKRVPIETVDKIVVRAGDVEMVEFLLYDEEIAARKARDDAARHLNSLSD